jgi:hypothetical protein
LHFVSDHPVTLFWDVAVYTLALEEDFPFFDGVDAYNGTPDGSFTGAGFANKSEGFALEYLKAHIVHSAGVMAP